VQVRRCDRRVVPTTRTKYDVPDGFKIDFTITRNVSTLEDLMVTFANNFQNGTLIRPGYLNESVNNWDGTISRY